MHAPGLDLAEPLSGATGGGAGPVDRSVDDTLVDPVVDEAADAGHAGTYAVDDAVEDVLVEPVGRSGDRPFDGAGDAVDVEADGVVLLDAPAVPGAGEAVELGAGGRGGPQAVPREGQGATG